VVAATGTGLVEMCLTSQPQRRMLVYSPDEGRSWEPAGYAPQGGTVTSLSGTPNGLVLVATTTGIDVSANTAAGRANGLRWQAVHGATAPGGFTYVGMTSSAQGVAIPSDASVHAVWFTYDGGINWQQSLVR